MNYSQGVGKVKQASDGTRLGPVAIPRSPAQAKGTRREELFKKHASKKVWPWVEGRVGRSRGNKHLDLTLLWPSRVLSDVLHWPESKGAIGAPMPAMYLQGPQALPRLEKLESRYEETNRKHPTYTVY